MASRSKPSPNRENPLQTQGEVEVVLAQWREVERSLETAVQGDRSEWEADAYRLRTEYRRLIDLAQAEHRPDSPPSVNGR